MSNSAIGRRPVRWGVLIALAGLAGCGTSSYEALMVKRLAKLDKGKVFTALYVAGTTIPNSNISVRLPMKFPAAQSYVEASSHAQDGAKIDPRRVQPPFLKLPGFKFCMEAFAKDAVNHNYPYYVYLAASPVKEIDAVALEAQLQAALKAEFPDTPDAFEAVVVTAPDDQPITWKRMAVKGDQLFDVESAPGQWEYKRVPGIFELWLHEGETANVVLGWRIPEAIEGQIHLSDLANASARTFVVQGPPPAPAAAPK